MKGKIFACIMLAIIILTGVGIGTGLYFRDNPDSFLPGNSEGYDDPNKNPSGDDDNSIVIPDEPNLPDDNDTTKPELPEQPEVPDDAEKPTEPELPTEPEKPEEPEVPTEPTEPVEPEGPDFSTFYIEIENEILSLKDFFFMMTCVEVETLYDKDIENVTYTLTFNIEELEMYGYDFEYVKEIFNEAINTEIITIEGENFSSTYEFNDDTFSIKIDYTILV